MTDSLVLWRRLDPPGHETARLEEQDGAWHLGGTAVFLHEGQPCRLDYRVICDAQWRTVSGQVAGFVGDQPVDVECSADGEGRWHLQGVEQPQVAGCIDLDLNFSPSTNLLPVRRLGLAVGEEAPVRAAWLRFPSFRLEPLEQVYRRTAPGAYRYESAGGSFTADLEVNGAGFATRYAGLWEAEPALSKKPAEPGVADGVERRLDPRALALDRTVGWITGAVLSLGLLVPLGILLAVPVPGWVKLGAGVLWGGLALFLAWRAQRWPEIHHHHVSYKVDDLGIEIRSGVLWRGVTSVPRSRVQHTDVSQGPLERRYGLGKLAIYTAGTTHARVDLAGLDHGAALRIRDHLLPREGSDGV
ncbi:MAG TPA: putative glycolipid-binding domain-containing protein [Thermoanaerobaculia bacterium]|nr:putative glycolipid-binding domain-containing protein [Thermoanaerobaculia bacterium]